MKKHELVAYHLIVTGAREVWRASVTIPSEFATWEFGETPSPAVVAWANKPKQFKPCGWFARWLGGNQCVIRQRAFNDYRVWVGGKDAGKHGGGRNFTDLPTAEAYAGRVIHAIANARGIST